MAVEWTVAEFDPRAPAFAADPYPFYARLRREDPVHFVPAVGTWWATRYADVVTILKDGRFGKEPPAGAPAPSLPPAYAGLSEIPRSMLNRDPPDHTRLRSLVNKAFTPRVIEQLRPHIDQIAEELLDKVVGRGNMDLVAEFAFPLPAIVIAELLGVPQADRERFKVWSDGIILSMDGTQPKEVREQGLGANLELFAYLSNLIAGRREQPRDDLIGALIAAEEHGDRLKTGEIVSMCLLLLVAGHETTTSLIGSGALTLLLHPDELALLRRRPGVMPSAIEEFLRYEPPVHRVPRIAHEEVELGGKPIPKGATVLAVVAAANRDPEVFNDPETLDITRQDNPHLAFGRGIHYCLGASLAVVEAEIAFAALLRRFSSLALDDPGPRWGPGTLIRGLRSLPVRF